MQVITQPKVYPVIVIGSGASGGMAAWNLTRQGVDVVLLDAGDKFDRSKYWTHATPWETQARLARGDKPETFFLDTKEQPYFTPNDRPFALTRVWGHGGKTNVWGRVSLRYSDIDLKAADRDGWEISWPISYKDIAPYYDQVEQLIGVNGGTDDSDVLPGSKYLQPPPAPRCGERLLQKAMGKLNIPVVAGRRANMTRSTNGFPACHYCGNCGNGCDTASFFCSADHLLPFALKTGKLELRSNAVAARILTDENGRATGVQYFDRRTGSEQQVRGKVIVLGASCVDSTRILLNSKSRAYPDGVGNSSGLLGCYLSEHIMGISGSGFIPVRIGTESTLDDGRPVSPYIARFRNVTDRHPDFIRGYHFQGGGGCFEYPDMAHDLPGYGKAFKSNVRKYYPAMVSFGGFGEVLPRRENRVTINPRVKDAWGIPVLNFDYRFSDNELKMTKDMADSIEEMLHAAGAEDIKIGRTTHPPGYSIHEIGTARMGNDPKTSVTDSSCRLHDVKNIYLADAGPFVSGGTQNTTWTILAMAWRTMDFLKERMRTGDV